MFSCQNVWKLTYISALMYACIFGNMVAIVQRLYLKASVFHNNMNTVREFMRFYKISEPLQTSINNYIRRDWAASQGVQADIVSTGVNVLNFFFDLST